jgi:hypothetical protein
VAVGDRVVEPVEGNLAEHLVSGGQEPERRSAQVALVAGREVGELTDQGGHPVDHGSIGVAVPHQPRQLDGGPGGLKQRSNQGVL